MNVASIHRNWLIRYFGAAFGLTTRFLHEGRDYGELETGSTALAFSAHKLMRQLEVLPWGKTIAYVADINGFLVELCTPTA